MGGNARRALWMILIFALLMALPTFSSPPTLGTLSNMMIAALFAMAFSLLMGQGGMLSFGHAAYFAIGCFATVHVMQAVDRHILSIPTPLLPLVGGIAAGLIGGVAGIFATLRSGVYFSMVTLAIAELFYSVAPNLQSIFGGESGLSSMRQAWGPITFAGERDVYWLVLAWVALCALAMWTYTRTSFGRITVALRENERRLAFLGYHVHATKAVIFSISSMFAGIAGGLLAVSNESANYILFDLSYSVNVVLYSFIGGLGALWGPAFGAAAMTLFGHVLSDVTGLWLLYQGLIFVLMMVYAPAGAARIIEKIAADLAQGNFAMLGRKLLIAICIIWIGAAVVLPLELTSAIFARDYQTALARTGQWQSVRVFGRAWQPLQWTTWAAALGLLALGASALTTFSRSQGAAKLSGRTS